MESKKLAISCRPNIFYSWKWVSSIDARQLLEFGLVKFEVGLSIMRNLKTISPSCSVNPNCSQWARTYFIFSKKNLSLSLEIASFLSWGVAEVPQIITNYREKSTDGLSISLLPTWIVGDIFNVTGCLLEPATLQTQFYMVLLYTTTTRILSSTNCVLWVHLSSYKRKQN